MNANAAPFVPSTGQLKRDPTTGPSFSRSAITSQPNSGRGATHTGQAENTKKSSRYRAARSQQKNPASILQESSGENSQNREVYIENSNLNNSSTQLSGSPSKKEKVSLNHLLNFSLPPRQRLPTNLPTRRMRNSNYQPFNKERFVNANFRFVVKASGSYAVQLFDPDVRLEWNDVEQVIVPTHTTPNCPICLTTPLSAGRITKCGHTFCFPCILHYLDINETKKAWRKCPICWDAIYVKDLKCVRFWKVHSQIKAGDGGLVNSGERLTMRLMLRHSTSTIALPRSPTWPQPKKENRIEAYDSPPWHFTPDALIFSKFMLASGGYMTDQLKRDIAELNATILEANALGDTSEVPYIEMATRFVRDQLALVASGTNSEVLELQRYAEEMIEEATAPTNIQRGYSRTETTTTENAPEFYHLIASQQHPHSTHEANESKRGTGLASKLSTIEYYYFQAEDGQYIYLHPLDIRILKQHFGTYENFPDEISIKVCGVEESTMNEELRKKCKYLSHLPLSCDVTFIEADLKGIVSNQVLNGFANELKQRRNRRKEKAKKEERRRLVVEERKRLEQTARDHYNEQHFNDSFSRNTPTSSASIAFDQETFSTVQDPEIFHLSEEEDAATSYANIAQSRTVQTDRSDAPRTVWGTPAIVSNVSDSNTPEPQSSAENEPMVVNRNGKKKLVLFSTNSRRAIS
ncbi:uncharacterized protein VTP21DRAFT_10420 [Calcarisporiella thermophila]|uniref:uncharacterized protein n=1 Tax=Calcarisporiella thermophila TaxID=911321 RepID=UPI0037448A29